MPQQRKPNDLSRSLTALDMDTTLIAVVELSLSSWLVAGIVPGVERSWARFDPRNFGWTKGTSPGSKAVPSYFPWLRTLQLAAYAIRYEFTEHRLITKISD